MKKILVFALSLFALTAASLFAGDATGKWTGKIIRASSEGDPERPAYLILKQEGAKLTGGAGPNADEQYTIQNGKAEDDTLTFEVKTENALMKFTLKQTGDEIKGDVLRERDGQTQTAKLDLKREK